jgi:hypothetical protein
LSEIAEPSQIFHQTNIRKAGERSNDDRPLPAEIAKKKRQLPIKKSVTISKARFTRRPDIYQATRRVLAERKLRSDEAVYIGQLRECERDASPSAKAKLAFNSCDNAVSHSQKVNCQPGIS